MGRLSKSSAGEGSATDAPAAPELVPKGYQKAASTARHKLAMMTKVAAALLTPMQRDHSHPRPHDDTPGNADVKSTYLRRMTFAQWAAKALTFAVMVCAVCSYFRTLSENTAQKHQISQQAAEIHRLTGLLQESNSKIGELQNELTGEHQNFESVSRYANTLQTNLSKLGETKGLKPLEYDGKNGMNADLLQTDIEFHRSRLSEGLLGLVTNASDKYVTLTIKVYRPKSGQHKTILLQLGPNDRAEVGHLEGWQFESGDRVSLAAGGFPGKEVEVP